MDAINATRPAPDGVARDAELLQLAFDHAGEGISVFDADMRLLAWNARFLVHTGLPAEQVQRGVALLDLLRTMARAGEFGPCDVEAEAARRQDSLRERRTPLAQRERPNGRSIELRQSGTPDGGFVMLYTDITERLAAERRLLETRELLAQKSHALEITLQSLTQGVLTISPEGRIVTCNRRALDLLELDEDVLRAHPTLQSLAHYQAAHGLVDLSPQPTMDRPPVYQRTRRDGMMLEVRTTTAEDGSVVRTYTDITARLTAEDALRAAKEEAERANRAKSDFLSRMSHELRTPLNAVLGFAQLLQSDAAEPLSAAQRERVHELMRGGRHLLSLINEVLDIARIEAGALQLQLVPVPVQALVDDCLPLVQAMADERHITLRQRPPAGEGCQVLADPVRLRQVLLNLLSNAVKYNRRGGQVEIEWRPEPELGMVHIAVNDTGPGLDAAQQARLFQAFERLDAANSEIEGAGIGLALSKWLIDEMRGSIGVHSVPGRGSSFWLRLACGGFATAAPVAAPPEAADSAPGLDNSLARTVLYIEDNPVNQLLMQGMLAQRPALRLLIAGLPETGLVMATQARPDLVLLDIQLPGMDGYEVLRRLRAAAATRHIPVVAVSANAMQSDLDDARAAGFADYVTKPLDLKRLLAVVDGLLAETGEAGPRKGRA